MEARTRPGSHGDWPSADLERVEGCPVCGGVGRRILHADLTDRVFGCAPGRWTLHQCGSCLSAYLDPRPTVASIGAAYGRYYTHDERETGLEAPGEARRRLRVAMRNGYLNARYGYAFHPAIAAGARLLGAKRRREADQWIRHLPWPNAGRARLLDVGCGNGGFLRVARAAGWSVTGLEPDPAAASIARLDGLEVIERTLAEARLPASSFEAVTASHVLEHLHDPAGALREVFRVLVPGGLFWVATPNVASLGHRRFGRDWRGLEPPRHLVLFEPDALAGLLGRVGFEPAPGLVSGSRAKWFYRASTKLRLGLDPGDGTRPPAEADRRARREAARADRETARQPGLAEEITFLCRKPVRAS